jgi:hypothetical protein
VETKLEKRVVSRLNAQYVFMSKASGGDVCEYLHNVLSLSGQSVQPRPAHSKARKEVRAEGSLAEDYISVEYTKRFNTQVEALFGKYGDTAGATTEYAAGGDLEAHGDPDDSVHDAVSQEVARRKFVPGALHSLLSMHTDWGRDLR